MSDTVMIRVSGTDRPGILAGLLTRLDRPGVVVRDIEQITIHGHLDLSVVVAVDGGRDLLGDLLLFGWEERVQVDVDLVEDSPAPRRPSAIVTVVAPEVLPAQLQRVAAAVASVGGTIERILHLARRPVDSYELQVADAAFAELQAAVVSAARAGGLDVAVQREGLYRRATRLVVMDVDSTLIRDEVIDLLADEAGCGAEVAAVTEAAMRGELDFAQALHRRVALLAGLDDGAFERVRSRVRFASGARTFVRTLRRLGYRTAMVSGGFIQVAEPLRLELGIDHAYANTLEVVDGHLTGRLLGPIVDRAGKAAILQRVAAAEGVALDQVVAIGDGANDLDMLEVAGLGIAYNAKPAVRDVARASLSVPDLDAVLFLLGVPGDDIERDPADVSDPAGG